MPKKYTKEILISELKRYYAKHGVPGKMSFVNNPDYPSYPSYLRNFGGLENALIEAGIFEKLDTNKHTKEQLINKLIEYYVEHNKVPSSTDFIKTPKYPSYRTYVNYFGSWNNALKIAGLDFDSMLEKKEATLNCSYHKGRMFEIIVLKFLKEGSIDLAGQNCNSPFDGICPKGYNYDCKGRSLRFTNKHGNAMEWKISLCNKHITKINYIIIGGFTEDYSKLLHMWVIPIRALCFERNEIFYPKASIHIPASTYGLNKWKKYEVTDKCLDLDKLLDKMKNISQTNV